MIDDDVIRSANNPVGGAGSTFVLRGNLAPDGCVIKPTAAEPHLLKHRGRAIVFDNYPDLKSRINDDELDVTPDDVIVLRSAGPLGAPGFPEWGMLPIPQKLLKQGVRDMVRISGRADERHELRDMRFARISGVACWRSACPRPNRRRNRIGRRGSSARTACE